MAALFLALRLLAAELPPFSCPADTVAAEQRFQEDGKSRVFRFCQVPKTKQKHGPAESWLEGKLIAVQPFKAGKRHGVQRTYSPKDRSLRAYLTWKENQLEGFQVKYDDNGRLAEYGFVGLAEGRGPYRQWRFRRGALEYVASYLGDKEHGRYWGFHPNGRLAVQRDHVRGVLVGRTLVWTDDGSFVAGTCHGPGESTVWSAQLYEDAVTRECPSDAALAGISPPAADHAVPAASVQTQDSVPLDVDIPGLVPPIVPTIRSLP